MLTASTIKRGLLRSLCHPICGKSPKKGRRRENDADDERAHAGEQQNIFQESTHTSPYALCRRLGDTCSGN
jgi:hypothetical protein